MGTPLRHGRAAAARPLADEIHQRRRPVLLAMLGVALALGCGRGADRTTEPTVAGGGAIPATATAAPAAPRASAATTTTGSNPHELYAANGFTCENCHPCGVRASNGHGIAWMDSASAGFHAYSANANLASCQGCHGAALDGVGGSAAVSCAQCHGASWKTSCVMCHGGTDGATGAPPRTVWGRSSDAVRVGAHTAHVGATHGLASAIDCGACHPKPVDALSPGHVGGATADVRFAGLASQGVPTAPAWNRATATCAGTYCHGATLAGGAQKVPVWTTLDGSQRACTACHGVPPPAPHVQSTACGGCHAGYTATLVNAAIHVDGKVDVSGMSCTSCHGDASRASTTLNPKLAAAPPVGTRGETATTYRAVGAHLQHLQGGTLSNGVACSECHTVPPDTSPVHQDGAVTVTFGTLARTGGSAPTWTQATNTCATSWCHGAKLTGGSDRTPIWTKVDGTQDACGTCHGRPPTSGEHGESDHRVSCGYCHGGAYTTSVADKSLHFNGKLDVAGPRIRTWNATTRTCQPTCHGSEHW